MFIPQKRPFSQVKHPNDTVASNISGVSINLEQVHQRNQYRLQRLDNVDPLEGSAFKIDRP
jgi:hypothetical protein